jgi:hypothetical protein
LSGLGGHIFFSPEHGKSAPPQFPPTPTHGASLRWLR